MRVLIKAVTVVVYTGIAVSGISGFAMAQEREDAAKCLIDRVAPECRKGQGGGQKPVTQFDPASAGEREREKTEALFGNNNTPVTRLEPAPISKAERERQAEIRSTIYSNESDDEGSSPGSIPDISISDITISEDDDFAEETKRIKEAIQAMQ